MIPTTPNPIARTEIFLVLSILVDSSDNEDSGMATDSFNELFTQIFYKN